MNSTMVSADLRTPPIHTTRHLFNSVPTCSIRLALVACALVITIARSVSAQTEACIARGRWRWRNDGRGRRRLRVDARGRVADPGRGFSRSATARAAIRAVLARIIRPGEVASDRRITGILRRSGCWTSRDARHICRSCCRWRRRPRDGLVRDRDVLRDSASATEVQTEHTPLLVVGADI